MGTLHGYLLAMGPGQRSQPGEHAGVNTAQLRSFPAIVTAECPGSRGDRIGGSDVSKNAAAADQNPYYRQMVRN